MNDAALIEDWNSIIPFKIKANELETPTEKFLFKCVLSIFKLMHYDVSNYEYMYNEPFDILMVRRVEFVARINYIYQLCSDSKQTSYFFVDLVKPTAKKVKHLLKILLNYLFYINMVKETVLEKANRCTEKYNELKSKLNQEQIVKEEIQIRANNMNRDIDELKNKLPQINQHIEALVESHKLMRGKLAVLEAKDQDMIEKILNLKKQLLQLAEHKVTDDEALALIEKKEALERELIMLTENENQLQENNAIHAASIHKMQPCIILLEKLSQYEFDTSCRTLQNELKQMKLSIDQAEQRFQKLKNISDGLTNSCKEMEAYIADKQTEFYARNKVVKKVEQKHVLKLRSLETEVSELEETDEMFMDIMKKEEKELEMIENMKQETLDFIENKH
ncbi:putative leucine-rich repeat-containing protein DDB_G0290503 [Anopheles bellator]|uniref:putative leucine-rich repeat-containing protein DDB_G0290503 n=1 Tax=Anopheles bellator TaxID=139047 RepID=UPI0026488244|nr:putative leucine-rich repeat-containing protein DDB_G0290503 [Anopheles bellator]